MPFSTTITHLEPHDRLVFIVVKQNSLVWLRKFAMRCEKSWLNFYLNRLWFDAIEATTDGGAVRLRLPAAFLTISARTSARRHCCLESPGATPANRVSELHAVDSHRKPDLPTSVREAIVVLSSCRRLWLRSSHYGMGDPSTRRNRPELRS